jgi:hypothetical protein
MGSDISYVGSRDNPGDALSAQIPSQFLICFPRKGETAIYLAKTESSLKIQRVADMIRIFTKGICGRTISSIGS